jgi:glycosyltransferase involved in cell wall biosynthesis
MPSVTVLMTLFNSERHLRPAIDSILAQTYRAFELLIVDDGSSDGSRAIVASYDDPRIRLVVNSRNLGLSAALNRGLSLASGELIARQDPDDLSMRDRLERQIAVMADSADLAILGTQAYGIDEDDRPMKAVNRPLDEVSIRWYGLFDNPFIHTSVLFRRDLVRACGEFDTSLDPYAQDYALWSLVMRRHTVRNLSDRLVTYRVRASSISGAVEGAPEVDGRRPKFERVVRTLVQRNVVSTFGRDVTAADAELAADFVLGIPREDLARFLTMFSRLLRLYQTRYPDSGQSADFARTLARQADAIAYRVSPPGRSAALRVYAALLGLEPGLVRRLPWLRVAVLLLLGREGRVWINSMRRYTRSAA